ncbi:MAG: hypothetical protein CMP48_25050 [Rickettsiales bacterium]|nr:hypothetical protein [Rickettsiales bacterium]
MLPEDSENEFNTPKEAINPAENEQPAVEIPVQEPKKSKTGKIILISFLLVVLLGGGWFGYKFLFPQTGGPRINPLNLVPADAFFILESDRPYTFWTRMGKTQIWKTLQKDEEWKGYGDQLHEIENMLATYDKVLDEFSNRTIYISGHIYRGAAYDYLFVFDMDGMALLRTYLTSQSNLTKRVFNEQTIYEQTDPETKETLYFTFIDNFFIGSYTHTLVESSISGYNDAELSRSFEFIEVRKKAMGEGFVRLYLNHQNLMPYLETIIGKEYTTILEQNLPLHHTGSYFDVEESSLLLEGYSNFNDSLPTYLPVFRKSGTGGLDISKILPATTALYFSIGFDSFSTFYDALDEQASGDEAYGEDYSKYTNRTERFLDIDLKEDFASWIDDEVAVAQLQSEAAEPEIALIFKGKDGEEALEKMEFLSRQIRRKTPVKFKQVDYKSYPINFMSVKGIFNLVLGNLFSYFDRPYYTVVDKYVIFSNHPKVLRKFIDNWIEGTTLAQTSSFQSFKKQIGEDHSAMIYLQLPLLEQSTGGMIDDETIALLKNKRSIIADFPQMAIKISPSDGMYRTTALVSIDNVVKPKPIDSKEFDLINPVNYDSLWAIDPGEQVEITALEVELDDFAAEKQSDNFENGELKYEVEIKDGQKHGSYFEYYESGELKAKGKYKNDLKEGTWKYYDESGNLIRKERYKNGEIN